MDKHIFFDETKRRLHYSVAISFVAGMFFAVIFGTKTMSFFVDPKVPIFEIKRQVVGDDAGQKVAQSAWLQDQALEKIQLNQITQKIASAQMNDYQPEIRAFYVNWDVHSRESLEKNIDRIDVLVPEWLHLKNEDGEIAMNDKTKQREAAEYIQNFRPELKIAPLINNYNSELDGWDDAMLAKVLEDQDKRSNLVDNIFDFIKENGFSGINIDFENIAPEQQPNFLSFMQEIGEKFHSKNENLEVSVSIPLDNPEFDAKKLGQYADLIYLMAYDQHTISNTNAGPVASQVWISTSLMERYLNIDPSKTIVAMGTYGYNWSEVQEESDQLSFQEALALSKDHNAKINFDPISANLHFDYRDEEGNLHHVWFQDSASAYNQMVIANKLGSPKGYALWRLGSEDPSLWQLVENSSDLNSDIAKELREIPYGSGFDYEGQGEILRVTAAPQNGQRQISMNKKAGNLIEEESFTKYPSNYQITRFGGKKQKKVVLTFDDGPNSLYTSQILDILKQQDAKATFFVIGISAEFNRNIIERIVDEGHEIGSHTYSHPNMASVSKKQLSFELTATERAIEAITGRKTTLFRPPYGENIEPDVTSQIEQLVFTSERGYYTVGIHIDPKDWRGLDAEKIADKVIEDAKSGEGQVVLLHDGGGNREETVAALPMMIEGLRKEGFEITTVGDLIGIDNESLMPALAPEENFTAEVNSASITAASIVGTAFRYLFLIGIILGFIRVIFVGVLAIFHKIKLEREKRKNNKGRKYHPKVSVVVPAYNEEKVIVKTVRSILRSDYDNFDVIVVDDGSKDNTFDIAEQKFSDDPRVRVLQTPRNGGKSKALNYGIKLAKSSFIVAIDADTILKKDAIAKLMNKFTNKNVAAVAGNAKVGNRRNIMTRWQALEYITSQNMDRRAQDVINGITVVPGAIGAWRRAAVLKAGGFTNETLAEDADLTLKLLRRGYRITYENEAIAYTEAPDTVRTFLKQRFRWMFGTLQVVWKHKDTLFRKKYGAIGTYIVPNVFVFQIFFPLISPLMDLMLILSVGWAIFQHHHHPAEFPIESIYGKMFMYYMLFLIVDFLVALVPYFLERKEDWKLLFWQPLQRFFYRQLMYYVAIKSFAIAICGNMVGWGKFDRKATVSNSLIEDPSAVGLAVDASK